MVDTAEESGGRGAKRQQFIDKASLLENIKFEDDLMKLLVRIFNFSQMNLNNC